MSSNSRKHSLEPILGRVRPDVLGCDDAVTKSSCEAHTGRASAEGPRRRSLRGRAPLFNHPLLAGARPESARTDSGRAKIPEGVRFAAARLFTNSPLGPEGRSDIDVHRERGEGVRELVSVDAERAILV